MSELSFLIELLLNHKIPKKTKDLIKDRISLIESHRPQSQAIRPQIPLQAPSMQRSIEEMENGAIHIPQPPIATSPGAAQALQKRQQLIDQAARSGPFGGHPEPGRTSPKKF